MQDKRVHCLSLYKFEISENIEINGMETKTNNAKTRDISTVQKQSIHVANVIQLWKRIG
jgi:hypothetical protein